MVNLGGLGGGLLGGLAGGASITIVIRAVDQYSKQFRSASTGLSKLKTGLIGVAAVAGIAAVAIGAFSLKAAADFEQTNIAFTTLLGSAEKAKSFLEGLSQFAIKTPFTLPGVEKAARQLLAVGFEAKEILPTLKMVGDVSSGLGLGEVGLQRLILNLGQVRTQGKLTGRELRDFAVAGVPLLDELAKSMGKTKQEIAGMVSKGEIGFDKVIGAFRAMSTEGGKFEDLMEKQSKSLIGMWSNFMDSLILVGRAIGQKLLPVAKAFLNWVEGFREALKPVLDELLPPLSEAFKTLGAQFKGTGGILTTVLVPIIKGLLIVLIKVIQGINVWITTLKINWGVLKLVALNVWQFINALRLLWAVVTGNKDAQAELKTKILETNEAIKEGVSDLKENSTALVENYKTLFSGIETEKASTEASEIKTKALADETAGIEAQTAAIEKSTGAIQEQIKWKDPELYKALTGGVQRVAGRGLRRTSQWTGEKWESRWVNAQKGGIVQSPTLLRAGEAGPEAIIPLGRKSGFGGVTINISRVEVGSAEEFASKLQRMLETRLSVGG